MDSVGGQGFTDRMHSSEEGMVEACNAMMASGDMGQMMGSGMMSGGGMMGSGIAPQGNTNPLQGRIPSFMVPRWQ